ncbi:thioesterase [Kitasatospora sp. MMS16-BH015]|uniref:acyl-CoA thioesterase n=1 Tax=Kitasatospora sp. MMS16-BH015 TaxID=2018025 RepID=UPI000CA3B3BE|nr:thioesterase family protein [Kitasatospora sp. MMS16-BH015]AUG80040.1 thioesterase [Kitasatospora sp. MMS16-BH015]
MARHIYACPLRWSDMDAFGHVNNVVFLRYLEEARIDFMFTQAAAAGAGEFAGGSVVARHEIDYKRPLVHRPAPVTIETWVTKIGGASLTVSYEIKDTAEDGTETVYVRASTVVVPYDLAEGRPRRISAVEREFLGRFMDAAEDAVEPQAVAA